MQLPLIETSAYRSKNPETPSPTRLHYLTFSTCPYESTTISTASPDRSSSRVRERRDSEPKAQSIKSGCSRKSKYSIKGTLQKNSIFEKVDANRERDTYQKQSRQLREELEGLLNNLQRLTARRAFLQEEVSKRNQLSRKNSRRVRTLLQNGNDKSWLG